MRLTRRFPLHRMKAVAALLGVLLLCASCGKTDISTGESQSLFGNKSYYLTPSSSVRIYWKDSGLGTFVSQLSPSGADLVLPPSLQTGDYGSRTESNSPYLLDLVAMVYVPDHPSGDFYFESPFLGPSTSVTNVTTALSWYLRWGFGGFKVRMSKNAFDQLNASIEVICDDCRKKTNSEVLTLIRAKADLLSQIRQLVIAENPSLNLAGADWTTPPRIFAYSNPGLSLHGVSTRTAKELDLISITALYLDPLHSTVPIEPSSWSHVSPTATSSASGGTFSYSFTYLDSGPHTFTPLFASPTPVENITFIFSVDDVNQPPICTEPILLTMRANMVNFVPLSTACSDPDADNSSLVYTMTSGPGGLTLGTGGMLRWLPSASVVGNSNIDVSFFVTDAKMGVKTSAAKINVTVDKTPVFTSVQTSYAFTEGSEGTFTVTASDEDADPVILYMRPVTPIVSGFPAGAGSLTQITRTGSAGAYSYVVKFTPSYLQTIGANGVAQVKLLLGYDNTSGNYDSSLTFDEKIVTFNITNTDDPPQWDVQPPDLTATEGADLSGLAVGHATDPNPTPTTITYSLVNRGNIDCDWSSSASVTKDGAGNAFLAGTPPYFTNGLCSFVIRATDNRGLTGDSAPFEITTTNVNRPIVVVASPTTVVNGEEGKQLSLPLDEMFNDPDLDTYPRDYREQLSFNCLVDLDHNGSYESTCAAAGLNFVTNSYSLTANWTPPSFTAGNYPIQMAITDVGGITATHAFSLVIAETPLPITLSTVFSGVETTSVSVNEATTYALTLRAAPATVRPVDSYDFIVTSPSCSVQGSSGTCSASLIVSPGSLSGTGATDFNFTLSPNYNDGNATFPATTKRYSVSFYAQKLDDPTISTLHSITVVVTNTNRLPTGIMINNGSFGCTGSTPNSTNAAFTVCVDAAQDKKSGNSWSKNYSVTLGYVDPDGNNDSYSYRFDSIIAPGTFTDSIWSFKLPSCVSVGTGTLNRTYSLSVSDGRGGTVARDVQLKVLKAQAAGSCL